MNLREAAQHALEALENDPVLENANNNATAWLRSALAQPEPRNQCGETCERAKLCAICTRGLAEDRSADAGKTSDHIADAGKMVEPVAWAVVGDGKFGKYELGNHFESEVQPNFKYWENRGYELIPLYLAQPKLKPLTDEEMRKCAQAMDAEPLAEGWTELIKFARAIERAHGIGGEE